MVVTTEEISHLFEHIILTDQEASHTVDQGMLRVHHLQRRDLVCLCVELDWYALCKKTPDIWTLISLTIVCLESTNPYNMYKYLK